MSRFPVCVLGAGSAGVGFINGLARDWRVEVVGFTNRSPDRRAAVARTTGVPGFADLKELLAGARARPRLAVIATANPTHKEFAIECLENGLDVFCEKPMAMTLADGEAMLAAERTSGRVLQIGFEYRYGSMTERLTELQRLGHFGRLCSVDISDSRGHWWPESPNTPISEVWRLNREIGGGTLIHCGIHQLDLLRAYAGEVAEIQAFIAPNSLSFYPREVPDHLTVQMRFASGATGSLTITHNRGATWYRPSPPWVPQYHKVPGHGMDIVIAGSAGAAIAELYREELHVVRFDVANRESVLDRTETFHHHHPSRTHHDSTGMVLRFIANLERGAGALHSAADSLATTKLAFACETAIQEAIASGWTSARTHLL